ncbi:response regulator transcription factor [Amycolatopsis sp. FU40]|uniref:response regulator transcription factor n=1 Tax=Amycolatopsis sp. FU40 TaxID=2914159 RepID=UPI00351CF52C
MSAPTIHAVTVSADDWPSFAAHLTRGGFLLDTVPTGPSQAPHHRVSKPEPANGGLSERELQVLQGMAGGKSNADIAAGLFLSPDTVKTHARRLFKKLGVGDRAEAVAIGYQQGILGGAE